MATVAQLQAKIEEVEMTLVAELTEIQQVIEACQRHDVPDEVIERLESIRSRLAGAVTPAPEEPTNEEPTT